MRWSAVLRASLALSVVPVAVEAASGYRTLVDELDAYRPPALYVEHLRERPAPELPSPPTDSAFQAQLTRLLKEQQNWEEVLRAPRAEAVFLVPDPDRIERLKAAAADAGAAQKALSDGFLLEDLEALALLRSPPVQAKEAEFRAALESYGQVANLDEILRQYSAFTASLMTGVGPMQDSEAVALKFPFPGVLALKGEVATQESKAAWETLEAARRGAVTAARKAYWELVYIRRGRELTSQMLDLLDHLKAAASARYEAGQTNFQDVIKVGIERERAKEELATLGEEQRNAEAVLRALLNLPPEAPVGAPAPRDPRGSLPRLHSLYPVALERRQELRAMRAEIGKMERMLEMAETMVYPGFSLNLSLYERDEISRVGTPGGMAGTPESFPTSTTASTGAGLPKMPWYGANDAYLRETRKRLDALRKSLQGEEAATALGVREAWFRLDKARREENLYGDRIVILAEAALEASTRGYSAGTVAFSDVIGSYTGWFEANLARERSRSDLGVARAELQEALGTSQAE
jgi:cobalt-zinc-cadmium efflux system outer membrane protein